jgi:hypothetical protein
MLFEQVMDQWFGAVHRRWLVPLDRQLVALKLT